MDSYFDQSVGQSYNDGEEVDDENTFKILLATDVHLGYGEKEPERENDSFLAFEECLQYAQQFQVDFVLLGGDLYHDNKPSRTTQYKCIELLRKYCLGETPAAFEFLSSRTTLSHSDTYNRLNYEDPNLNVGMPVFSIHGNHDDPAGHGGLCALDIVAAAGLINFFGKTKAVDSVEAAPLLMRKGSTLLAIYGIGAMRDERLHRMFLQKRVSLLRPKERTDDFFNLLCIHQNRSKHGAKNFIPESFLDDFLDLVFWGHEHESIIGRQSVERNSARDFYVTQPGSTVATSLADGESAQKHCALLQIRGKEFSLTPLPLKTVRQLYVEHLDLSKTGIAVDEARCQEKVEKKCTEIVKDILKKAKNERSGDPRQPFKPLIRVKVDASGGYPVLFPSRFGHQFAENVANPKDILLFHKRRLITGSDTVDVDEDLAGFDALNVNLSQLNAHRLEDIISELMEAPENKMSQLKVLTEVGLRRALEAFVDKEDKDSIANLMKHQVKRMQEYVRANVDEDVNFDDNDEVERLLRKFHLDRLGHNNSEEDEVLAMLQQNRKPTIYQPDDEQDDDEFDVKPKVSRRATPEENFDDIDMDAEVEEVPPPTKGKRGGRGSRGSRARGSTTTTRARGRGRGRGRGTAASAIHEVEIVDEDDDIDLDNMPPPVTQRLASTRASSRGAATDIRTMFAGSSNEYFNASSISNMSQSSQRKLPTSLSGDIDLTAMRGGQGQKAKRRPLF